MIVSLLRALISKLQWLLGFTHRLSQTIFIRHTFLTDYCLTKFATFQYSLEKLSAWLVNESGYIWLLHCISNEWSVVVALLLPSFDLDVCYTTLSEWKLFESPIHKKNPNNSAWRCMWWMSFFWAMWWFSLWITIKYTQGADNKGHSL